MDGVSEVRIVAAHSRSCDELYRSFAHFPRIWNGRSPRAPAATAGSLIHALLLSKSTTCNNLKFCQPLVSSEQPYPTLCARDM